MEIHLLWERAVEVLRENFNDLVLLCHEELVRDDHSQTACQKSEKARSRSFRKCRRVDGERSTNAMCKAVETNSELRENESRCKS